MTVPPTEDPGGTTIVVTPDMLTAAWATWRPRHGGRIGPGPAFTEALRAGIEASPHAGAIAEIQAVGAVLEAFGFPSEAWGHPSDGVESALSCLIRARNDLHIRARTAEAELARLTQP